MTEGLSCTCMMSLIWRPASFDEHARQGMMHEAALLLAALNQMESAHDLESGGPENRRLERVEAKLDLALHLLSRALEPGQPPAARTVQLTPQWVEWEDALGPDAGTRVILELRPSEHLPLTLRLPGVAVAAAPGWARVGLEHLSEMLDDTLHQFVFRRHRQAIRSRAGG